MRAMLRGASRRLAGTGFVQKYPERFPEYPDGRKQSTRISHAKFGPWLFGSPCYDIVGSDYVPVSAVKGYTKTQDKVRKVTFVHNNGIRHEVFGFDGESILDRAQEQGVERLQQQPYEGNESTLATTMMWLVSYPHFFELGEFDPIIEDFQLAMRRSKGNLYPNLRMLNVHWMFEPALDGMVLTSPIYQFEHYHSMLPGMQSGFQRQQDTWNDPDWLNKNTLFPEATEEQRQKVETPCPKREWSLGARFLFENEFPAEVIEKNLDHPAVKHPWWACFWNDDIEQYYDIYGGRQSSWTRRETDFQWTDGYQEPFDVYDEDDFKEMSSTAAYFHAENFYERA